MSIEISWPCRIANVAAASMLSGCGLLASVTGRFEMLDLRIQHSRIDRFTPAALALTLTIDIYNPNAYALRVQHLRYAIEIAAQERADGRLSTSFELPSRQSHQLELPLEIRIPAMNDHTSWLGMAELPYSLHTTITISDALRQRQVDMTQDSVLRLDIPLGLVLEPASRPGGRLALSGARG